MTEHIPRLSAAGALLLTLLCGAARADIANLEQFLRDCEAAAQVTVPLRGDGHLEVTSATGTTRSAAVVIVRPPTDTYIELDNPRLKAVLLSQGQAYREIAGAAKAEPFAADAALADSDFIRADLEPFQVAHYAGWRISDESSNEVTVTLFPINSPYTLEVITFDRVKLVPVKTLYYRDTQNNLVKIRRDADYMLIGRKWMPATVSMETFKLRTHSTLSLHWTQNPSFPPELFDPVFLPRLSAPTVAPPLTAPSAATPPGGLGE